MTRSPKKRTENPKDFFYFDFYELLPPLPFPTQGKCRSDKETGWSEGSEFSDLETPDYEEIVDNEFGSKKKANPLAIVAAIIVTLAFIAAMVLH